MLNEVSEKRCSGYLLNSDSCLLYSLNHLTLDQLIHQRSHLLGGIGTLNDLALGTRWRRDTRGDTCAGWLGAQPQVGRSPDRNLDLGDALDSQ